MVLTFWNTCGKDGQKVVLIRINLLTHLCETD